MPNMQQLASSQSSPEIPINENFVSVEHQAVYAMDPDTTGALVWGYLGGRWGGFAITAGTVALTDNSANYVVVASATGVLSTAATTTHWTDSANYGRAYKVTTLSGVVSAVEDHRVGPNGVMGIINAPNITPTECIVVACSDETTVITAGTGKVTFRMPYALTLTAVRGSLTTAQPSGSIFTVDINQGGTSVISTKLTIDNTEKTSTTAATPAVISTPALTDDAEMTIDVDQVGAAGAAGLKVYLIGHK